METLEAESPPTLSHDDVVQDLKDLEALCYDSDEEAFKAVECRESVYSLIKIEMCGECAREKCICCYYCRHEVCTCAPDEGEAKRINDARQSERVITLECKPKFFIGDVEITTSRLFQRTTTTTTTAYGCPIRPL